MPNGHGGILHFGSPIVFALMFFAAAFWPLAPDAALQWTRFAISLALAALVGWRLAYHLHMWRTDEYGGSYLTADEYRRATRRYAWFAAVYAALTAAAGFALLWWRGLP